MDLRIAFRQPWHRRGSIRKRRARTGRSHNRPESAENRKVKGLKPGLLGIIRFIGKTVYQVFAKKMFWV